MLYHLHMHWLWFFGALSLGIVVGWLIYQRAAIRSTLCPVLITSGAVAIGAIMAISQVVPGRYGYPLEFGVILTIMSAVGCFVGWALRDLAEFVPAAHPNATALPATNGSYLFRDAFAGMGAGTPYMRAPTAAGGVSRERLPLATGSVTQAPALGGYTFPRTLPFADATTSRRAEPVEGLRRHWSWPRPASSRSADT